jgi:dTDP-4-dehydrorhamnose reductase
VETILTKAKAGESLRLIDDVRMSSTYARDAAQALEILLRQRATGIFI